MNPRRIFSSSRGSILILVLWVLIFFTMLVVALGARTRSQISAIKRFSIECYGQSAANSGISYVIEVLRHLAADEDSGAAPDTNPKRNFISSEFWRSNPKYFQDVALPGSEEKFSIGYYGMPDERGKLKFIFGLDSEENRININAVSQDILFRIYLSSGEVTDSKAQELAKATVDWRSRKEEFLEFGNQLGDKGSGFGSTEELLTVPGMSRELWTKIKNELTVYGSGQVNLNTVPGTVLARLGLGESLIRRIQEFKDAFAKSHALKLQSIMEAAKSDERPFKDLGDLTQKIGVSSEENASLQNVSSVWTFQSSTFHFISVAGSSKDFTGSSKAVECLVSQDGVVIFLKDLLLTGYQ